MKLLRFLPIVAAIALVSCIKSPVDDIPGASDEMGLLKLSLSVDDRVQIVPTKAGALDPDLVPHVDSVYVDLYRFGKKAGKPNSKETWNRIYFGKYEDAKDTTFRVNAGQWKMLAFHGDSTACGFDKPYYKAEKEFYLDGGLKENGEPNITYVSADVIVSNVRITVNFDETVAGSYYDYFLRFSALDQERYKQIFRYKKDHTKDVYMMPSESFQIEFMAQHEFGDESSWKYAVIDTIKTLPNDHVTIDVRVKDPRYGRLDVEIITDDSIVEKKENVEILENWAPQDYPQVVAAGFKDDDHAVVEGDAVGNSATLSVIARAGIKNFFIKIDSDYLVAENGFDLPLGQELDLANPASVQASLDKLAAAGFEWQENILGLRKLTYLTMTDFFKKVNDSHPTSDVERNIATITVRVVDEVGHETNKVLTSTAYPIRQTLSIPEGNVWATRIESPVLDAPRGLNRLFVLQTSSDGITWSNLKTFDYADGSYVDFGTIPALPSTDYYFRTIYNNNDNLVSNVVKVRTEDALQLGNPGFEYFHTKDLKVDTWFGASETVQWYLPYLSTDTNPWWAVNSRRTVPSSTTPMHINFKSFPCTAYSTDRYSGEKSAMVYTVSVNDANTDGTSFGSGVPGEIWLGKADDSGNHSVDGHAFASRPASVRFWYRYSPLNADTFAVYIKVLDASGNIIAYSEKLDGEIATNWTQCEIPVLYSKTDVKAATFYICFKSSTTGETTMNKSEEIAGTLKNAHMGSVLRIDDVELIY